jgi:hypothetical protein
MTRPYITAKALFKQAKLQAAARDEAHRHPTAIYSTKGVGEALRCDITREWLEDAAREIDRLNAIIDSQGASP